MRAAFCFTSKTIFFKLLIYGLVVFIGLPYDIKMLARMHPLSRAKDEFSGDFRVDVNVGSEQHVLAQPTRQNPHLGTPFFLVTAT
jgi:hypothetical protein